MNIKMADFLFEDENKEAEGQGLEGQSGSNQSKENDADKDGRAKFRSKISDEKLFSKDNPELKFSELKTVAVKFADVINSLNPNIEKNHDFQKELESIESEEDLSDEQNTQKEKIENAVKDSPLGLITKQFLMALFKRNLTAGQTGKIGRVHLNPLQLVKGADQIEGGTPADIKKYENYKMFFGMLANQDSKPIMCNGKIVIMAIPAFGENCLEAKQLYDITYPGMITKDTPVAGIVTQVYFGLATKETLDLMQTNPVRAIGIMNTKAMQSESFVYRNGISSLLNENILIETGVGSGEGYNTTVGGEESPTQGQETTDESQKINRIIELILQVDVKNANLKKLSSNHQGVLENSDKFFNVKDKLLKQLDKIGMNENNLYDHLSSNKEDYRTLFKCIQDYIRLNKEAAENDPPELVLPLEIDNCFKPLIELLVASSGDDADDADESDKKSKPAEKTRSLIITGAIGEKITTGKLHVEKATKKQKEEDAKKIKYSLESVMMLLRLFSKNEFDNLKSVNNALDLCKKLFTVLKKAKNDDFINIHRFNITGTNNILSDMYSVTNEVIDYVEEYERSDNRFSNNYLDLKEMFSTVYFIFNKNDIDNKENVEFKSSYPKFVMSSAEEPEDDGTKKLVFKSIFGQIISTGNKTRSTYGSDMEKYAYNIGCTLMLIRLLHKSTFNKLKTLNLSKLKSGRRGTRRHKELAEILIKQFDAASRKTEFKIVGSIGDFDTLKKRVSARLNDGCAEVAGYAYGNNIKTLFEAYFENDTRNNEGKIKFLDMTKKVDEIFNGTENKDGMKYDEKSVVIFNNAVTFFDTLREGSRSDVAGLSGSSSDTSSSESSSSSSTSSSASEEKDEDQDFEPVSEDAASSTIYENMFTVTDDDDNMFTVTDESDKRNTVDVNIERKQFNKVFLNTLINTHLEVGKQIAISTGGHSEYKKAFIVKDSEYQYFVKQREGTEDKDIKFNNNRISLYIDNIVEANQGKRITNITASIFATDGGLVKNSLKTAIVSKANVRVEEEKREEKQSLKGKKVRLTNKFNDEILKFEKEKLVPKGDKDSNKLKKAYIKKFGEDEWKKFTIYAYYFKQVRLSRILRESRITEENLLSRALFENNHQLLSVMLNDFESSEEYFINEGLFGGSKGLSDDVVNWLINVDDNSDSQTSVTKPIAWMDSIGDTHQDGEVSEEERVLMNQEKIKKKCALIIESSYEALIKKDWEAYESKKESERQGRKSTRKGYYEKAGEKTKDMFSLSLGVSAGAVILSGGFAALPWLFGAGLFKDEVGSIVGGALKTGSNIADFAVSATSKGIWNLRRGSLQKKLEELKINVNVEEESKKLYEAYTDIVKENISDGFIRIDSRSLASLLFESDDTDTDSGADGGKKDSNEKRKIKEEDVFQIIQGSGLKLFSPDFKSRDIYNSFMTKLNGILRKYDNITITGISRKSPEKTLAKDQINSMSDATTPKGTAASPFVDMLMRQVAESDDDPTRALAGAINDINHSGGEVANLLYTMMIINPEAFAQMFNKPSANKGSIFSDLVQFMGGGATAEQAQINSTPDKFPVTTAQKNNLNNLIEIVFNSDNFDKSYFKYDNINALKKEIESVLEVKNDISLDIINRNHLSLTNILLKSLINQNKSKHDELAEDLLNILNFIFTTYQITSTAVNDGYDVDKEFKLYLDNAILPLSNVGNKENYIKRIFNGIANYEKKYMALKNTFGIEFDIKTANSIDYDSLNISKHIDFKNDLAKLMPLLESKNYLNNKRYITGSLSNLLFEDFSDKKDRNINKKDDKIDLRKEWLKLWDI